MPNFTKAKSTESDSHDSEARERGSVEAVVEGEKLEASLHSVGADHEVGENTSGPGIALRLTLYIQGSRCRLMAVTLTSIKAGYPLGGRGRENSGREIPDRGGSCSAQGDCGAEAIQGLDEEARGKALLRGSR